MNIFNRSPVVGLRRAWGDVWSQPMPPARSEPPASDTVRTILEAVKQSGLSLRELEAASGVPRSTIVRMLAGEVPQAVQNLLDLGKAVGVTVVARRRRPRA
jgi:lambda repressor-like predicted transcriptional regulator